MGSGQQGRHSIIGEQTVLAMGNDQQKWKFGIDLYYRAIKGIASFSRGCNNLSDEFFIGKGKILGAELLIQKRSRNFNISGWDIALYHHLT